ncbi:hypothetical protein HYQ46_004834 [Verticillium longisporum]|nr:hypothetical protein HYQ46_004834 [Verticillium longisporum]
MSTADVAAHDNYDTMYPGQLIVRRRDQTLWWVVRRRSSPYLLVKRCTCGSRDLRVCKCSDDSKSKGRIQSAGDFREVQRLSMAGLGMTGVYHHNIGSAVTLQDELRELETLLYRLDERDREFPGMLRSREHCDKRSQTRKMLLHRTRRKWMDYGKTNDVRSLKNASRYQLGYLSSFFRPRPPIDGNENFLVADGDLKSVRPDGDGVWLDEVLLYLMIRYECRPLRWLFGSKISQINDDQRQDTRQHTRNEKPASARALSSTEHVEQQRGQRTSRSSQSNPRHTLYDRDRIHAFTMVILIGLLLCFLAGPLYPLYSWVQGEVTPGRMGMIMGLQCVCTLLFGMVLAIFTNAKRHEIFTASATYMAILVVFMGQSPA